MSMSETFIAIFLGSKTSPRMMPGTPFPRRRDTQRRKRVSRPGKRGSKSITLQSSLWAGLSARPKR